jgi:hypothetical protein
MSFREVTEVAHESLSNRELAAKLRQLTEQLTMPNRMRSVIFVAAARIENAATWADEDHEPIDLEVAVPLSIDPFTVRDTAQPDAPEHPSALLDAARAMGAAIEASAAKMEHTDGR